MTLPSLLDQLKAANKHTAQNGNLSARERNKAERLNNTFNKLCESGKNLTIKDICVLTGLSSFTTGTHVKILLKNELVIRWKILIENYRVYMYAPSKKGLAAYKEGRGVEWLEIDNEY